MRGWWELQQKGSGSCNDPDCVHERKETLFGEEVDVINNPWFPCPAAIRQLQPDGSKIDRHDLLSIMKSIWRKKFNTRKKDPELKAHRNDLRKRRRKYYKNNL
jgi:hypothetical protein